LKIKCPFKFNDQIHPCNAILESKIDFYKHLREWHKDATELAYTKLIFKIHEKKAECYNPQGILCPGAMDELDLLNSLLEDKN